MGKSEPSDDMGLSLDDDEPDWTGSGELDAPVAPASHSGVAARTRSGPPAVAPAGAAAAGAAKRTKKDVGRPPPNRAALRAGEAEDAESDLGGWPRQLQEIVRVTALLQNLLAAKDAEIRKEQQRLQARQQGAPDAEVVPRDRRAMQVRIAALAQLNRDLMVSIEMERAKVAKHQNDLLLLSSSASADAARKDKDAVSTTKQIKSKTAAGGSSVANASALPTDDKSNSAELLQQMRKRLEQQRQQNSLLTGELGKLKLLLVRETGQSMPPAVGAGATANSSAPPQAVAAASDIDAAAAAAAVGDAAATWSAGNGMGAAANAPRNQRAQTVALLKTRLGELKRQKQLLLVAASTATAANMNSRSASPAQRSEVQDPTIRRQEHAALVVLAEKSVTAYEQARQQAEASVARNRALEAELTRLSSRAAMLLSKTNNDDELITCIKLEISKQQQALLASKGLCTAAEKQYEELMKTNQLLKTQSSFQRQAVDSAHQASQKDENASLQARLDGMRGQIRIQHLLLAQLHMRIEGRSPD